MDKLKYINYYSKECDKRKIKKLYYSAFPKNERCPYSILKSRVRKKRGEFFAIYEVDTFIGLIYNITHKDMVYIYYFAIEESSRNKGYGSKILTDIKEMYKDKRITLMAETLDANANNFQERINRNKFYSKNGFYNLGYTIRELDVVYDMLGTDKSNIVKKEEFKELIKFYFGNFFYNRVYKKISDIEE